MTPTERRQGIKAMIDLIEDTSELDAVHLVLEGIVARGGLHGVPPVTGEITDEQAGEYDRRVRVVLNGGGVPQEEVERRYGLLS